ncbi:hypothetical protein QBC46DRAFT_343695 [Diplogelasinospora grovesii]|uniref:Uncharacterized protein n=1 Tax=Diplogelasinospora grovesii TaxID=303347 RepID=A0AAN6S368_9PEZI|nr:hypothetical protein QBC46DRAFT_343695 [Diplogelasinospora grovesii]
MEMKTKMKECSCFSSALYSLVELSIAQAITITRYVSIPCYSNSIAVSTCSNIASNTYCTFPRGGNQVQGVWFSNLYTGTIGVFYQSSSYDYCSGHSRGAAAGYSSGVCVNSGTLSTYFSGGAA